MNVKTKSIIPGLYVSENVPGHEAGQRLKREMKKEYTHDEVYGRQCTISELIECPVDFAFSYVSNILSVEEWTYSVRGLEHQGNGLYRGYDVLVPNTQIFIRSVEHPESRTVDHLCAWDQGDELWMRYFLRFFDAGTTLGGPGTLLVWTNFHHAYYERNPANPEHVRKSQARTDRPWVGDLWNGFPVAHAIEARNLKLVLEHKYAR